ncbi:Fms-interacting protein-domain-containing protein [Paraphysoderma sedebokerense]|nr:Fms-interacting protein-domain-containing protein [Paraphysoderma sedebokerense]
MVDLSMDFYRLMHTTYRLEARITRLNKKQSLLEKDIDGMVAKKDQFESTVLKWLKGAQEIQKETGLDLSKSKHNDNLTRLLPKPLFNLYGKLTGFRQNFDSNVIVQIAGDIPEAERLLNLPPQSPERYSQMETESLTAVDRDAETETESSPAHGRNQASKFDSQVSSRASTPSSENGETDVSMHAETVEENVVDKRQREDDDEMDVDVEFKRRKVDNPDTEDVSSENVFKKWPVHITMVITNSQHPYILRLTFSYLTELKLVSVHHSIDPTPELSNPECTYPSDNIFRDLLWSGDEGLELPTVSSRSMVSSDIELSPALLHGFVYQWLQRLVDLHVDEPVYTGSGDIPTALVELDTIDALKKLMERWNGWLEVHYVVNILGKNEMIYVPPPLSISKLEEESELSLSDAKCVTDEDATSLVVALEFNYLGEPRPLQIHIPCTFPHSPPSLSFTSFVSTFAPDLRPRLLDHLSRLTTILSSITFPAVNKDESDRPGTPVIGRDREKVKNEKEREKEREREFKKLGVVGKVIVTAVRGLKLVLSGLKKDQDENWEEVAEAIDSLK